MKRFFILLSILSSISLFSQYDNTYQTWLDYDHHNKLNGNWVFFSDYGFRWSELNKNGYFRFHARPSVEYRISISQAAYGGLGMFYQDKINSAQTFEFRPWQGYKVKWPAFGRIRLYHLFRLEERYVIFLDRNLTSFTLKGRYKIGTDIPLNNSNIAVGTFYIPVSFEIFGDIAIVNSEVFSDRNRTEVGLGLFAYFISAKYTI